MNALVENVDAAFRECNVLRRENEDLKTALRRIVSLGEKNVAKARDIAREALVKTSIQAPK